MLHRLSPLALVMLRNQRWVFGTWQADELGLSQRTIRREVGTGLWQRLTPRTVLALPSDPEPSQLRMAAPLELGPAAVLGGLASMIEHGWDGGDGDWTDVLVLPHAHLSGRTLPRWIRPRYAVAGDTTVDGVARTSAVRSVLDAAAWAMSDRQAAFFLLSAVQQGLATARELLTHLDGRPRLRRRRFIGEILGEAANGATSMPELDFRRECRRRGLPEPRMQTRRRDASGRARCTDAEFDLPDGSLLIVEINGSGHDAPERAAEDTLRTSALARATGAHVLTVPSWQLRSDPDMVFGELTAWLGQADQARAW